MSDISAAFKAFDQERKNPLGEPLLDAGPERSDVVQASPVRRAFETFDAQSNQSRQAAIAAGMNRDPERTAKANSLARETGLPAAALGDPTLAAEAERRVRQERFGALAAQDPAVGRLAQSPDFVAVAQDDAENLGFISRIVRSFKRGFAGTQAGIDVQQVSEGMENLQALRKGTDETPGGAALAPQARAARPAAILREAQRTSEALQSFGENTRAVEQLGPSAAYRSFQASQGFVEGLGEVTRNPVEIVSQLMSESLGSQAITLPTMFLGAGAAGARGLALATGLSSGSVEMTNALTEILAEKKVNPADTEAVMALVTRPEFHDEMARKVRKALVIGAFDALGARLAGVKIAPKGTSPAVGAGTNIAAQTVIQMGTGGAGEAAGALAAGEEINPIAVLSEMIAEVPGGVADVATLTATRMLTGAAKAEATVANEAALAELAELKKASKLASRDPESFQRFVDEAAKDGEVTDVYVDANTLVETLNQNGVDPMALERAIPGLAKRVAEARDVGGDVRISVGEFAAHIAGTPAEQTLVENMRTDIDGPTIAEAREFMAQSAEAFSAEAQTVLEQRSADAEFLASADTVRQNIAQQLNNAGRFTSKVNAAYAELTASFYTAMASRLGMTPEQMFKKYPVRITNRDLLQESMDKQAAGTQTVNEPMSTRVPTAKKATEDAFETPLQIGLDAVRADPKHFAKQVDTVLGYPNFKPDRKLRTPEAKLDAFVQHATDNLLWIYDQIPEGIRNRSRLWYDGARAIAERWAPKYGISEAQAAGVLAVLSPQKDWFQNVSLAERVLDVVTGKQDFAWSEQMEAMRAKIVGAKEDPVNVGAWERIRGKKYSELADFLDKAMWVRTYDEAHNPRSYQIVSPEGDFIGWAQTMRGGRQRVAWGSYNEIGKAVAIAESAGDLRVIHDMLGGQHKVRSFYNNIFGPNNPDGHVTIDTHAVAAALLRPLAGGSLEVLDNFGASGKSAMTGARGTYGIYSEAYARAAKARGVLPREMQSITWEAIRALFPADFKSDVSSAKIDAIWQQYRKGKVTIDEARQLVLEASPSGFANPEWVESGGDTDAQRWASSYSGELLQAGVSTGRGAESVPAGGSSGSAGSDERSGNAADALRASRVAEAQDRAAEAAGGLEPLAGLPTKPIAVGDEFVVPGPFAKAHEVARAYMERMGFEYNPPRTFRKVDPERAARIAAAYEAMPHAPNDPQVKAAYDALVAETIEQYRAVLESGLQVEFIEPSQGDPYEKSPRLATEDVIRNNHMWVFSTRDGFGSTPNNLVNVGLDIPDGGKLSADEVLAAFAAAGVEVKASTQQQSSSEPTLVLELMRPLTPEQGLQLSTALRQEAIAERTGPGTGVLHGPMAEKWGPFSQEFFVLPDGRRMSEVPGLDNPLLAETEFLISGKPALVNDLFRVVHDYFGHVMHGTGFRHDGEENAWRSHAAMYSPLAGLAATSETRGQNSWVNFGPFGAKNRTASAADTVFADQKTGLLPTWVLEEGRADLDPIDTVDDAQGELVAPPVNDDGTVTLTHWSRNAGISQLDPKRHGQGLSGAESKRKRDDPANWVDRSYFGIGVGQPGGYAKESGLGANQYEARIPVDRLYDIASDPQGLRPRERTGFDDPVSVYEKRIRDAGFAGYWRKDPSLGLTAAVFEGLPVTPAETVNQGKAPAARGRLSFTRDITQSAPIMQLLEKATLSTFIHESGHFYLEVLTSIAEQKDPPAVVVEDVARVLAWFGVPDLKTWRSMDVEARRPLHEQFARGFEAYVLEGRAPSNELTSLFSRFRSWLLNVYRSLAGLKAQDPAFVDLTDEVRGVFDRMLATDAQIAETEKTAGFAPVFQSAKAAGMTEDEWTAYQSQLGAATAQAVEEMQARSVRDMQRTSKAHDKAVKELTKEAAKLRKAIRSEVEREVRGEPLYQVIRFLRRGEMRDGTKIPAGTSSKLDEQALAVMLGGGFEPIMERLGKGYTVQSGGLHPDFVANAFGFTSGDHLLRELIAATPEAELIDARTDVRMLEEHGELASPEDIKYAASQAVHNEARARAIATEMRALARMAGGRDLQKLSTRAAKAAAETAVNRTVIRELRPFEHASNAARAARQAEEALRKNSPVEAATHKRNQLLNHYAARFSHDARQEVQAGINQLRRFEKDSIRAKIPQEYLDQIDALLERFELRPVSERELGKRKSLKDWVEKQRAQGIEPVIDEALLDRPTTSIRTLTLEEFRGLVDSVTNIAHLGRLKNTLLANKHRRELNAAATAAARSIADNAKRKVPDKVERNTFRDRMAAGVKEFFALHRKVASIFREMDGWKDNGELWNLFVRGMNDAGDKETVMRAEASKALHDIMRPWLKRDLKAKVYIPELRDSLSLEGRIAVALNWGNDANRQRVLDGDRWTDTKVQAVLKTLTAEDFRIVQAIWDHLHTYWPQIQAKELRVTGLRLESVAPAPFKVTTAEGLQLEMRGGYYPIKYDAARSSRSAADELAEHVKQAMQGLYVRATTRRGHTKARVAEVSRPVRKDLGVVFEHVEQVIHDLSWHEYLIDANRLLRHDVVDLAIREHYGPEMLKQLTQALDAIAAGDVPAMNVFERSVNHIRAGATIAGLAWNLTTAALQPFGLTQSMVRIGPKWVAKGLYGWLTSAQGMESSAAWIYERSPFMANRGNTLQREINELRNRVAAGKGEVRTAVEESYFWLIQTFQKVVDIPTWAGAYEKAMAAGQPEDKAIALADQAVLDSQGGGQVKDLAGIQRGGPLLKLWTNFYSFFNTTYNMAAEAAGRANLKDPLKVAKLALDYLLLFVIPAAMATILKAAVKGELDEDELLEKIAKDQVGYLAGQIVGVRELTAFATSDFGYSGTAGARFIAEFNKLGTQVAQGEVDEAALKAANNTAGVLLHYPAGAVNRFVTGFAALVDGRTVNPLALVFGPPKD